MHKRSNEYTFAYPYPVRSDPQRAAFPCGPGPSAFSAHKPAKNAPQELMCKE